MKINVSRLSVYSFLAMAAMLFMMTNVAMFAPQLNYLVWALIAAGLRLCAENRRQEGPYGTAIVV